MSKQCLFWGFSTEVSFGFPKANSSLSLEQGQDVGNMSHSVNILGIGQQEDRNQIGFLQRTEEKPEREKP